MAPHNGTRPIIKYLFILLALLAPNLRAQSTVDNIPDPKHTGTGYVSNPDQILDEATVAAINSELSELEQNTTVQVAVVAVQSIGNEDIFTFAQNLFTHWGIGSSTNDNGLLVLLVEDTHTIRFHTGYGLEGTLPDVVCKRIQRDAMLPEFKKGDYNAGILAGIKEVIKVLTNPAYAEELKAVKTGITSDYVGTLIFFAVFVFPVLLVIFVVKIVTKTFADTHPPQATPYPEMRLKKITWFLEFIFMPALILAAIGVSQTDNPLGYAVLATYIYFLGTLFHKLWRIKNVINRMLQYKSYQGIVEFLRKIQGYWLGMALIFPAPFLPYYFYHLYRKRLYRNYPRRCEQCAGEMHKLNEKADDEYLTASQQTEENIRAIDYDVWKCDACQTTTVSNYPNRYTKYKACTHCKATTSYLVSRETIKKPTYTSSGKGEEIHGCKHCGREKKTPYTIAKLVRSSSSSSSSSFGGSSSSGGSSSWGGGSSGGGGASSSW